MISPLYNKSNLVVTSVVVVVFFFIFFYLERTFTPVKTILYMQ
jgi:hypothetical protein